MEIPKKREAGILKSAATAGLVFLAGGQVEAQDFSNWRTVRPQEFERLHISEDMIQRVDANNGNVPVDETKRARVFTDRSNTTYYWINTNSQNANLDYLAEQRRISSEEKERKTTEANEKNEAGPTSPKEEKPSAELPVDSPPDVADNTEGKPAEVNTTETTLPPISDTEVEPDIEIPADAAEEAANIEEVPVEDTSAPETSDTPPVSEKDLAELEMDTVMEKLEEYVNRFEVKEAYVTSSSGKEYSLAEIPVEAFEDPEDKTDLSGALIIHDIETDTEYEVRRRNKHGLTDGVFYFAEALKNSNARGACLELLTKQGKTELSPEEKIKYLQEFFTSGIEGLKKYKQPKVSDDLAFKN